MIGALGVGLLGARGLIIGAVAVAVIAGGAWWHGYSTARDRWEAKLAQANAAARKREQSIMAAVDDARQSLAATKEVIDERNRTISTLTARVRDLSASNGRLRDQLAAYAASDTAAACHDRAQALATYAADATAFATGAFERLGAFARECAEERDRFAAEVIACVQSWPR